MQLMPSLPSAKFPNAKPYLSLTHCKSYCAEGRNRMIESPLQRFHYLETTWVTERARHGVGDLESFFPTPLPSPEGLRSREVRMPCKLNLTSAVSNRCNLIAVYVIQQAGGFGLARNRRRRLN